MDNIHSNYIPCIIQKEEKQRKRFESILSDMEQYIKASEYTEKVEINSLLLAYAILDYFEDVKRLKLYHHLEHINSIKIVSHMAYWLLKRKPIQVKEAEKELVYVNERFVLGYILHFLSSKDCPSILERENIGLKSYTETLFYFLKYRVNSADILELAITSFFAGQIYQEKAEDLSTKLAKTVE